MQIFSPTLERLNELIKDRTLNVDPLGTKTDLAGIEEDRIADSSNCIIEFAVGENNRCILSPQFERNRLHGRGDGFHDCSTSLRFAGEGNSINIRMLCEKLSR